MLKMTDIALCRNVGNCVPNNTAAAHPKDLKRHQQRCQNLISRIFCLDIFSCYGNSSFDHIGPVHVITTCITENSFNTFNVYGSVHREYIPVYIQQDATLHSLFISENCSTYFGWYLHPSSGAHTTVFTASGICHNVTVWYAGRPAGPHTTQSPI